LKISLDYYHQHGIVPSVICLQETWLCEDQDTSLLQIDNYNLIHKGKHCSAHGGVAFYLHQSFNYNIIPVSQSDLWDGLFIEVFENDTSNNSVRQNKVIIGNVYRPPRMNIDYIESFTEEITQILESFQRYRNVMLTGDFNLNLLNFKDDNNINKFLETMISLSYIPKISFPTRLTQRHGTLIDNFFIKLSENFSQTTSGILLKDISDHLPYFISLDYLCYNRKSYCFAKVVSHSSSEFRKYLSEANIVSKLDGDSSGNPNENYEILNEILRTGMNQYFPTKVKRFQKYKHKKCPWVTKGILISIKYRDKLYKDLRVLSTSDIDYYTKKLNLKTYNRILRQSIRNAKKLYYVQIFEKYRNDMKRTWLTIKKLLNKSKNKKNFPRYFLIDEKEIDDPHVIACRFNDFFINVGPNLARKIVPPHNLSFNDFLDNEHKTSFKFNQVDKCEVMKIIDTLQSKSSFGTDRISNKLLKYVKNELADALTLIFNQCIAKNCFPNLLKKAKVIPIHKKGDDSILDNYSPISVLNSISKVFEKLLHIQIYTYFKNNDLFYNSQYGFREGHSTELAAMELIEKVLFDLDNGKTPISLFLDLSKAFDTLDYNILLAKLKYYGFDENSLQLIKNYLSDRFQYVEYGDVISSSLTVKTGVPQGSVLGPLFFIIYMNDICKATTLFHPTIYADDTTLSATLSTFQRNGVQISDVINEELSQISNWLNVNKLSLNCSKTKAMIFHMPQKVVNIPKISMNNFDIEFVKEFNYLGIVIDKNLSWKPHTDLISKKISKTVGILNRLKTTLPKNVLMNIYNALVLPYLTYGSILWEKRVNRLVALQKKAIRAVTSSRYSAHTELLFRDLKTLKCTDLCALQCYIFCYKLEHNLLPKYFTDSNIFIKNVNIHNYPTRTRNDYCLPRVKHEFGKTSIRYKAPFIFNSMNSLIKDKIYTHSFSGYKQYIKTTFINSYNRTCTIQNCYSCRH
jgi:hypothetical protein